MDNTFGYILARQRSGTHAVRSILETNNNIKAVGEIFYAGSLDLNNKTQFHNYFYNKIIENPSSILNNTIVFNDYLKYIKKLFPLKKTILFDVKYNSINVLQEAWPQLDTVHIPYLIRRIRRTESPVIHITRYNYLKQYISELIASANKIYATKNKVDLKVTSIEINIDDMFKIFKMYRREDNLIKSFFNKHKNYVTFDYDEVFFASEETKKNIFTNINNIIGEDEFYTFESKFKKLNNKTLVESIINYNEVEKAIENSDYSYCINEFITSDILDIIRK